jgi:hypothetical protein
VSRQTVSEWSNQDWPFQAELSKRRAQALRDVKQRLEQAALMAVEVLAPIAADTDQPAGVPIKPSVAILEQCVA